ncbi:hypothetical protein BSK71_13885 [Pectobacterium actinidiae]|uniref:Uncharacterized protein n=1 Tax=Pectobacterium actinidiae TaxID=1507808 RepID=A0A1V2R226_9GAMM|nr:hypothetical protein [Pectobacterium actinidiae]KHN89269.1 hypothetical protein KKH3_37700 [Pectobacterium actinidiae]ONK02963.1 hypothetical protein BSK69_14860 [Pectobacterium actinidiae]ONK04709.1 hypothetical protein BSK71_13885 [Pectobacterium actinidiae]QDX96206.1 hypothetical protein EGD00_02085 [Pectobacterium carotovorum subsp. carotovorum]
MISRRNFILSGVALSLCGLTYRANSEPNGEFIIINAALINNKDDINKRLDKFIFKNGQCDSVKSTQQDAVKVIINVIRKSTMEPLIGSRVGLCLSDAFKAKGKVASANQSCNLTWAEIRDETPVEFTTYIPKLSLKGSKVMNPMDIVIREGNKFGVYRFNFPLDYLSSIGLFQSSAKEAVTANTLTDIAIELYGEKPGSSVAELRPEYVDGFYQVPITFILDDV